MRKMTVDDAGQNEDSSALCEMGENGLMEQTSRRVRSDGATGRKTHNYRLLVVVDESSSSKRAVEYVARVLASRRGFQVCLAYFLPQLPPALLEFGGTEDPDKEWQLDAQLKTEQRQWIAAARKEAQPALNWAWTKLRRAGLPAGSLATKFSDPFRGQNSLSEEILELARRNKCRTIVVGRRSLPWLRRLTAGKDLAETLVQQGRGLALWVVE
jgi:nucleotide-binding universal stress UspA family protein